MPALFAFHDCLGINEIVFNNPSRLLCSSDSFFFFHIDKNFIYSCYVLIGE